jgi:hypothetical protein
VRLALALLFVALAMDVAEAQDKTPRPTACARICPPCPPGGPCPPCTTECAVEVIGSAQVTIPAPDGTIAGTRPPPETDTPPAPVAPAPGTLELGYLGSFDGTTVMSGGGLRTTGHVADVWFVDLLIGGLGGDLGGGRSIWEFVGMLGVRVAGAVVPNVLRLFAALDTGFTARGIGGAVWGAFATDVGGGLEVGFDSRFTAGFFVDVRLQTRVPFEREPAFVGPAWSAGFAVLWF